MAQAYGNRRPHNRRLVRYAKLLHRRRGRAWIGTSEFADAAGLAAAQINGGYAGSVPAIAGNADAAIGAFTPMNVIGRDVGVGIGDGQASRTRRARQALRTWA